MTEIGTDGRTAQHWAAIDEGEHRDQASGGLWHRPWAALPEGECDRQAPATALPAEHQPHLETRKMREAREQQVPIVLCHDLQTAQIGSRIQAWVHGSAAALPVD